MVEVTEVPMLAPCGKRAEGQKLFAARIAVAFEQLAPSASVQKARARTMMIGMACSTVKMSAATMVMVIEVEVEDDWTSTVTKTPTMTPVTLRTSGPQVRP